MIDAGVTPDFPRDAWEQAANARAVTTGAPELNLPWSSIDNEDSEDLDQIEHLEENEAGGFRLRIGIADVDALVPQGSPVDQFAAERCMSVYCSGAIFPMLPTSLCYDKTSLCPDEPRQAMVVDMSYAATGQLTNTSISRMIVTNRAKLDYENIGDWLDKGHGAIVPRGGGGQWVGNQVATQDRLAQLLRRQRGKNGMLDLELIEPNVIVENGHVSGMVARGANRARHLIEDFMVAANSAISGFLAKRGRPSLQRVLPVPVRWPRIRDLAYTNNDSLPSEPDSGALSQFLARQKARDPEIYPDIALSVVKLLGPGQYAAIAPDGSSEGHFGLAIHGYVHGTAPNRRFPDIVTQRLIKSAIDGTPTPYRMDELEEIAARCNQMGSESRKIERFMRKVGAAILLSDRIGHEFHGIITGSSQKGVYVRIKEPPVEGRVVRGEHGLDVGDRVRVRLVHVNPDAAFIDFAAVR